MIVIESRVREKRMHCCKRTRREVYEIADVVQISTAMTTRRMKTVRSD
jgi:hypothetical protein